MSGTTGATRAVGAALALGFCLAGPSAHAAPTPGAGATAGPTPTPAFTLQDRRIAEASGMVADTGRQLFWIANDSGSTGVLFAVGPDGRTRGTMEYAARPVDVEALAKQGQRLFVGDIGDNAAQRDKVTVYYFDNPAPDDDRSGSFRAWDFVYPDGARDAEAMLVDRTGRIHIVTKEARGGIYVAPRQLRSDRPNPLTRVGDAPAYVTDGVFLPDGRMALRTYVTVEVLDPRLYSPVARAQTPFQVQGESMSLSLDGKSLLLGSEGVGATVLRVPIPTDLREAPVGVPTPPPSPTPSPAPASTPEPEPRAEVTRTGTLIAIALAFLASLAAGVVVWLRDRRPNTERPAPSPRTRNDPDSPKPRRAAPPADHDEPTVPRLPRRSDLPARRRD